MTFINYNMGRRLSLIYFIQSSSLEHCFNIIVRDVVTICSRDLIIKLTTFLFPAPSQPVSTTTLLSYCNKPPSFFPRQSAPHRRLVQLLSPTVASAWTMAACMNDFHQIHTDSLSIGDDVRRTAEV